MCTTSTSFYKRQYISRITSKKKSQLTFLKLNTLEANNVMKKHITTNLCGLKYTQLGWDVMRQFSLNLAAESLTTYGLYSSIEKYSISRKFIHCMKNDFKKSFIYRISTYGKRNHQINKQG